MGTYYKILPKNLKCREFQYHEGLNIDTKEITPYACDNGLHFSDAEHILSFCDYGSMIAEVELPEDATVYHFGEKSKADRIILKNLRPLWSVDTIEALILEGVEFESYKNFMFYETAGRGVLDVVKFLAEHGANIHKDYENALCLASNLGRLNIVKYLVEQGADIHTVEDRPLRQASHNGYSDIVKCLVEQGADIHALDDSALRWASCNGHLDVVKYLLEQEANIHARDDGALRWASEDGHLDIVKYLVEHGADIHAQDDYAIRHAGTPEIEAYLKSLL